MRQKWLRCSRPNWDLVRFTIHFRMVAIFILATIQFLLYPQFNFEWWAFLIRPPFNLYIYSWTTLFFSSKSPTFHLSLDFSIFDVFSSNFSSMKRLFIDGAFSKFIFALPPYALPPNAPPPNALLPKAYRPNALPPKAYWPNAHRLTARRT